MTANIIEFKSATRNRDFRIMDDRAEPSTETLSPTLKNRRLRDKGMLAGGDAVTGYWQARLKLNFAVLLVQRCDALEGRDHPAVNPGDDWPLLKSYRKALVEQLLTPAPTLADVCWKKAKLAGGQHRYVDCADVRSALLAGGQHTTDRLGN